VIYSPPLKIMPDIPTGNHFGSFGVKRKFSYHAGVDLYTKEGSDVYAIEPGIITEINCFSGPSDGSPWWNNTDCICIEGYSGVIVYGEMSIPKAIQAGNKIKQGNYLGKIKRILKKDKGKPMSMLHIMLLEHGKREDSIESWKHDKPKPEGLLDPTAILMQCMINYALMLQKAI